MGDNNTLSLQIECNLFFQENPYTFETLEGLSLRLGRNREDLKPILDNLVSLSILEKIGEGERSIYRYITPNITNEKDVI